MACVGWPSHPETDSRLRAGSPVCLLEKRVRKDPGRRPRAARAPASSAKSYHRPPRGAGWAEEQSFGERWTHPAFTLEASVRGASNMKCSENFFISGFLKTIYIVQRGDMHQI